MTITVIGTGYVGLVSGVCLAAKGHKVRALDIRKDVVDRLNQGRPHIFEEGLEQLLRSCIAKGRFESHLVNKDAFVGSELILIAVGTPTGDDGVIDLGQIKGVAATVGAYLKTVDQFVAVIVKSTVVPGTTDTVVRNILEVESGKPSGKFGLGMNPEFLREGSAVEDFMNPDRIVLGADDSRTEKLLKKVYTPWDCDKLIVNSRTAEMIKYANNCLLATQISATNELANIAATIGDIDIRDVMKGVQLDKRWSPILDNGSRIRPEILTYLKAGCGFGGSCFPKDVKAMIAKGIAVGASADLLKAVISVNEAQPHQISELLRTAFEGKVSGCSILLLGLAFKPGTDDVRESASLKIVEDLNRFGYSITAHDPIASENFQNACKEVPCHIVSDWRSEILKHDAIVVATVWPEYMELRNEGLVQQLENKIFIDARGVFTKGHFPESTYYATIGRRPLKND